MDINREKVLFASGRERCAAWHYPGSNGGCVVMAGGFAVPKEPATDLFAKAFSDAGFSVLAFDYRRIGESEGTPRLVVSIRDSIVDWQAAIQCARRLPEVDPSKVAIWGFSASGGHLFPVAAHTPGLAAVIAQTPLVDAPAVTPSVARYSTPLAQLRLTTRGVLDAVGPAFGRSSLLVPLTGKRGTVSMLSTPDALEGSHALNASDYPDWEQKVAARSILRLSMYRPGRHASRIACPLLVLVCDDDHAAPPGPAIKAAKRAPKGRWARLSGGHYAPFTIAHHEAVEIELSFLTQAVLRPSPDVEQGHQDVAIA